MKDIIYKGIALADFWYTTDPQNFKLQFDGINEAISEAIKCIITDRKRTIDIIRQDIEEIEDTEFTAKAEAIIKTISE